MWRPWTGLAGMLAPAQAWTPGKGVGGGPTKTLADLVASLTPSPDYKLLPVKQLTTVFCSSPRLSEMGRKVCFLHVISALFHFSYFPLDFAFYLVSYIVCLDSTIGQFCSRIWLRGCLAQDMIANTNMVFSLHTIKLKIKRCLTPAWPLFFTAKRMRSNVRFNSGFNAW
jgi:hypothetical protein